MALSLGSMKRTLLTAILAAAALAASLPAVGSAQEPVTLRVSTWWLSVAGLGDITRNLGLEYERHNPNVKIEWVQVGYGEYVDKMTITTIAGEAPDVMFVDQWWMAEMILRGIPMNLDRYIARDNVDLDAFIAGALQAHQSWWSDNSTYGLPILASPYSLVSNPTNFEERGLGKPPMDWDTQLFAEYARKLTVDTDGDGVPNKWALGGHHHTWNHLFINFGGEFMTSDGRTLLLDDPDGIAGINFLRDLQMTSQVINMNYDPGYLVGMGSFFTGASAMGRGPWNPDHSYWLLPFPRHERQLTEVLTHGFMVNSTTKHPDEAWDFVRWATAGEGAVVFARGGENPARMDPYLWNEWLQADYGFDVQDRTGAMPGIGDGTYSQPVMANWRHVYGQLAGIVERALIDNTVNVEVEVAENLPAWQAMIDEFWVGR